MSDMEEFRRFEPGTLTATSHVLEVVPRDELFAALARHLSCDWGDVCEEDRQINEYALTHGERLFSVYHASDGTKFWIITEWDRSATTILLPSDY